MKKLMITAVSLTLMTSAMAQRPAIPRDAAIESKIEQRLSKMSLDEKVGQMLELNLDIIGKMTMENVKNRPRKSQTGDAAVWYPSTGDGKHTQDERPTDHGKIGQLSCRHLPG